MAEELISLGLCLGATSVSLVRMAGRHRSDPLAFRDPGRRPRLLDHQTLAHEGNPKKVLVQALNRMDLGGIDKIAATGRKFRTLLNLTPLSESEAVEAAFGWTAPVATTCPAVVSAGGETFMVYILDPSGRIIDVVTGNKCASGTGEFFLQQLRRMDVTLEQAAQWAADTEPFRVSGRCSVFCKSDCTHATNKGVPKARVTAGLCRMMADKILELLKRVERRNIMLTGGTAQNRMMVEYLKREIPGLVIPAAASYFEALGAALRALDGETLPFPGMDALFSDNSAAFETLPPLNDAAGAVTFKSLSRGIPAAGDRCILGLDVGSTTTKAVLVRRNDHAMLASVYLRTSGDPVGASRRCYRAIADRIGARIDPGQMAIDGLGVCGSGRQIAGLHAMTDGVINEIIAHAAAAVHFDPRVDTLFEIGGQDAKYTYITNGVPSDYAMNEACSAGTGSFLEESALETLGLAMDRIADSALAGTRPPNFNDQCAAFIASDIKNAAHEGVGHNDIVAGLVYSICMNYNNRVRGNRPVGERIFMQGGVCYNRAVPLAMATLVGKPIVVPPEPGLMGAFGAALGIDQRLRRGTMAANRFDLTILADREVSYGKPFVCHGGKTGCDRQCTIARVKLEGRVFPFGGACNRYVNLLKNVHYDIHALEQVGHRQAIVFQPTPAPETLGPAPRGRVGINRSFLVHAYFPLYDEFFRAMGFDVVLPDTPVQAGIDRRNSAFCYPGELAHGFLEDLLTGQGHLDFLFLPHLRGLPSQNGDGGTQVCPLAQAEPYYLRAAFSRTLAGLGRGGTRVLTPVLDLGPGLASIREPLVAMAREMGIDGRTARRAAGRALNRQKEVEDRIRAHGRRLMARLEADPQGFAVVIFGRPYNAFAPEAHMGIPHKFASRGVTVIPMDFLPAATKPSKRHMYWGMGQAILRTARMVQGHPQLFGVYVTNFSCGPDSFINGYFRSIMGTKPSLTLELDSHTADAGLETRIEAFLDIVHAHRQLERTPHPRPPFVPARVVAENKRLMLVDSSGRKWPMTDPDVTVLFPSMGHIASRSLAAAFCGGGFHARAHRPADQAILRLGRGNTSCKECLPLILTTGTLLDYVGRCRRNGERLVYFMPTGGGPCRFGQYHIFMEDLIRRLEIPDVALFSLSSDNGYAGLSPALHRRAWWAVVISDLLEDMRALILTAAEDPHSAAAFFETEVQQVLNSLATDDLTALLDRLNRVGQRLKRVAMKCPVAEVPRILLTGEIFVRRDGLSRRYLTETLAEAGFAAICSPVAEWVHYADYLAIRDDNGRRAGLKKRGRQWIKQQLMAGDERRIRRAMAVSGLVDDHSVHLSRVLARAEPFIPPDLWGEAVLTVGSALETVASAVCGVIAIGPFGCMPNRISEAVLAEAMNSRVKMAAEPDNDPLRSVLSGIDQLPFLAIESDGSPFPQLVTAKLEAFCLRARRLHRQMAAAG